MRSVQVFVKGPARAASRACARCKAAGFTISLIKDVTADPAQRVPAPQASSSLKNSAVPAGNREAGRSTGPGGSAAWLVTEHQYAGFAGVKV
jgi:hypothetical protein